jgi:hypothetical protein
MPTSNLVQQTDPHYTESRYAAEYDMPVVWYVPKTDNIYKCCFHLDTTYMAHTAGVEAIPRHPRHNEGLLFSTWLLTRFSAV